MKNVSRVTGESGHSSMGASLKNAAALLGVSQKDLVMICLCWSFSESPLSRQPAQSHPTPVFQAGEP